MHQILIQLGSAPDRTGRPYRYSAPPDTLAGLMGLTAKKREGTGTE